VFGPGAIAELSERTQYEAWLLEAVYEVVDQRIAIGGPDELVYSPVGGPPIQTLYASGHMRVGDWRPGFLEAGAPLVFVSVFKLLDMCIEWVLEENGHQRTFRFSEKLKALRAQVVFPSIISTRPWLEERLIAAYERLEPLRGTVIHDRHFTSLGGGLQVSSSKLGVLGPVVNIGAEDLRNLAVLLVSLLRYLQGTWVLTAFSEKRIRFVLDRLAHLHGLAAMGQLAPAFVIVRVYVLEGDCLSADLVSIRAELAARRRFEDVLFDLRVVAVAPDGCQARAFRIPSHEVQQADEVLTRQPAELLPFEEETPAGMDLPELALWLGARKTVRLLVGTP
jgi:hypothetical protein